MKQYRKRSMMVVVGAGFAIVTLVTLTACGRVSRPSESIVVATWVAPGGATTSTECQDHTLPCAGPPITGVLPQSRSFTTRHDGHRSSDPRSEHYPDDDTPDVGAYVMTLTSKQCESAPRVVGSMYAVTFDPGGVRPSWTKSPFAKADQQITVKAVTPDGALPPDLAGTLKKAWQSAVDVGVRLWVREARCSVIIVWGKDADHRGRLRLQPYVS